MKILFSLIIVGFSLLLFSCGPLPANNNSNVATPPISPSLTPTPLLENAQTYPGVSTEAIPDEPTTGLLVAEEITKQLPEPTPVVVLPIRDGNLDEAGEAEEISEEVAEQLRKSGYSVQTGRAPNVAGAINKIFGRSRGIAGPSRLNAPSIGRLGTAIGIGAIILVGLANAKENERSVTTSIYTNIRGVFKEISVSNIRTKDKSGLQQPSQCTKNLLTNGDFEEDWIEGWTRAYSGDGGGSVTEVVSANGSDLLHMQHKGLAGVSLYQKVQVPKGRIVFQFESKFVAREGPIGGFSGTGTAGFYIIFLDSNNNTLGLVWIGTLKKNIFEDTGLVGVPKSPENTKDVAVKILNNGQNLNDRLDISRFARDRLGHLDLSKIKYVIVVVSVGATHPTASAEAWTDNLSLEVCP
jgi:hypothetical protein